MLLVGFVVRPSSKRRNFQCVYLEANGVRSRGLAARRTLWERKCKTNRMRTSLTRREHMKARRRWSQVRGAAQTLGTPFDPSMRRTCFVAFAHFLRFTKSLGTGSCGSSHVLRLEAPARAIPKSVWGGVAPASSHGFTRIPLRALVELWWIVASRQDITINGAHHQPSNRSCFTSKTQTEHVPGKTNWMEGPCGCATGIRSDHYEWLLNLRLMAQADLLRRWVTLRRHKQTGTTVWETEGKMQPGFLNHVTSPRCSRNSLPCRYTATF